MSHARPERPGRPWPTAGLLGVLALGAPVALARAEPAPGGDWLDWRAPAGCSTAEALRERVGELLGEPELGHVRRVEGRVSETRRGWSLRLRVVDAAGARERRLEAGTCRDLAEAAAVVIALAFEAAREEAAREEAAREEAAREEAAREEAARPPEPARAPRSEARASEAPPEPAAASDAPAARELALWLGLELVVDTESVAVVAPGVSLRASVRAADLELGAYLAGWPAGELSVAPGQSVSFALAAAGVRGCLTLGRGLVDTALCAGFEAGRLSASGAGLQQGREVHDLWLAPGLGLELRGQAAAGLQLHVRGEVIVPLLRQGYAVNAVEDVHHVAAAGARVAAGFLLGF